MADLTSHTPHAVDRRSKSWRWTIPLAAMFALAFIATFGMASASGLPTSSRQLASFQLSTRPEVPATLVLVAIDDTWNDDRAPTSSHAGDPRLGIADGSQACFVLSGASCTTIRNARSYVRFDLSELPAGANVASATLTLYGGPTTVASAPVVARRVTGSWSESMTYLGRPSSTSSGSVTGNAVNQNSTMRLTFDMTTMVRNRSSASIANGFELRPNSSDSWWYSSEWSDPSLRPVLRIVLA